MRSQKKILAFIIAILVTLLCVRFSSVFAQESNGFDLSAAQIPKELVFPGGPVKDGIPAIDQPRFDPAAEVNWLKDHQSVLSLSLNGETRAYPLAIMNWHEVVNDVISDESVTITYCPLCGTGMAFYSKVGEQTLSFGVSGLLYNSDVLLYDRQTESLWSQIMSQAVSGQHAGQKLQSLPLQHMSWGEWKKRYPQGLVLSRETGFRRDYSRDPYLGYDQSEGLFFPVTFRSYRHHPKERVLGVRIDDKAIAIPFSELAKEGGDNVRITFAGRSLEVRYSVVDRSGEVIDSASGETLVSVNSYWFAWYTFHPGTAVFKAE